MLNVRRVRDSSQSMTYSKFVEVVREKIEVFE